MAPSDPRVNLTVTVDNRIGAFSESRRTDDEQDVHDHGLPWLRHGRD